MENNLTPGQIRYRRFVIGYQKYRQKNREKLREANKLYKRLYGHSKEHFGGLRKEVLERDNYQCVLCGMSNEAHLEKWGRKITIDHIDGNGRYSKKPNNTMENLQTLCLSCHGRKDQLRSLRKQEEDEGY